MFKKFLKALSQIKNFCPNSRRIRFRAAECIRYNRAAQKVVRRRLCFIKIITMILMKSWAKRLICDSALIISLFSLSNCSTTNWYKPMGYMMFHQIPKGGSPGFNLGWIHGCQSGLGSQFGNAFYMDFYTWSRDPDITSGDPDVAKIRKRYKKELKDVNWNDPSDVNKNFSDYNTIFWGAHSFCRHSILSTQQSAGMNPALPGEERWDPMKHNLGSIWQMRGRGDVRIGSTGLW